MGRGATSGRRSALFELKRIMKDPVAKLLPKLQLDSATAEINKLVLIEKAAEKAVSKGGELEHEVDTVNTLCGEAKSLYECMTSMIVSTGKFQAKLEILVDVYAS